MRLFVPLVDRRRRAPGAAELAVARRRYRGNPKKLARAERREARLDARWIAWRNACFDLIAGKPHLPSLQPLGPGGAPPAAAGDAEPATRQAAEAAAGDRGRQAGDAGA